VTGLRACEADCGARQRTVEIRRREVAGAVVRGVGIGDILGEEALALLMPLHSACAASTRSEYRKSALPLPHYWADFAEIMVNARLKYGFGLILPLNRRLPCECSSQSP
jgi:hypothetical protein